MCGRYTLYHDEDDLTRLFDLDAFPVEPRYNIAPTQPVPIIAARADGTRERLTGRWGLVPHWVRDAASFKANLFNARSESAADKPSFREAMRRWRCLVPASGFYEWADRDGGRQPYYLYRRDGGPLALAGLYSVWSKGGAPLLSFTILTTRPNAEVAALHDRMPVILEPAAFERWLDPGGRESHALDDLLAPLDDGLLAAYPVGRAVGSPRRDDAGLIERLAQG